MVHTAGMRFKVVAALATVVLLVVGAVAVSASLAAGDRATATEPAPAATDQPRTDHPGRPVKGPDERWKKPSPAEKARTMRKLTREHARGMRAWARCKSTGRDDCVRPLPPGLAKKQ
jgi:hypothetical protein